METTHVEENKEITHSPHKPTQNTLMAVLAYFGPLVLISYLSAKEDPFVKFHIKQGLVLLCIYLIVWVVASALPFYFIYSILRLINIAVIVLAILGVINAAQGKEIQLPVVGPYARYFNL